MITRALLRIADALIERVTRRRPDFIVGGEDAPYLLRWWVIPRNPVFNIYLHRFLRDDDDRALHDHPWLWCSILLSGGYMEHSVSSEGGPRVQHRFAPSIKVSGPRRPHRIELFKARYYSRGELVERPMPCWTLFITGPRVREWYFHCPGRGLVHWRDFTKPGSPGETGPGCDAPASGDSAVLRALRQDHANDNGPDSGKGAA